MMILLLFGDATAHRVGVRREKSAFLLVVFAEAQDQPVQGL